MKKLVVFGTGEGARLILWTLGAKAATRIAGFAVDREYLTTTEFAGKPVVPVDELTKRFPPEDHEAIVIVGHHKLNTVRQQKYQALKSLGYAMANIVHESNDFDPAVLQGDNCLILQRQLVHLDVRIGSNIVMWSGCHLGDRTRIGDHVWLGGMVCLNGDVDIGDYCVLGSNCTISSSVRVAEKCFIGASALINKCTKPGRVYIEQETPELAMSSGRYVAILGR